MSEKSKIILVIAIVGVIAIVMTIIAIIGGNSSEKVYEKFQNAFNGENPTLVFIGRPSCGYCQLLEPSLEEMETRYNFTYLYVNTDSTSTKYMNMIMSDLGVDSVGTPYLAIVSNGKVVATQKGYSDYDITFKFLQDNKVIANDAKLSLNYIELGDYKSLIADDKKSIIVVGQSTCIHCIRTKLVLNKIVDEYGTKINYLNVSYLDDNETAEFKKSFDYFGTDDWGTPVTIVVKNGEIVGTLEGEQSEQNYVSFFEEQGVLK